MVVFNFSCIEERGREVLSIEEGIEYRGKEGGREGGKN